MIESSHYADMFVQEPLHPDLENLSKMTLVTGSGRSGTRYVARLFANLGMYATHEGFFTPYGLHDIPTQHTLDSSWLGIPWLAHNGRVGKIGVIHVVRHPLHVIGSFVSAKVFEIDDPYRRAIGTVIDLINDPVRDATVWWMISNRIAARYSNLPTQQVETIGTDWMVKVGRLYGAFVPEGLAGQVLYRFGGRDENRDGRRGGEPMKMEWGDLPGDLVSFVREQAAGYGY